MSSLEGVQGSHLGLFQHNYSFDTELPTMHCLQMHTFLKRQRTYPVL